MYKKSTRRRSKPKFNERKIPYTTIRMYPSTIDLLDEASRVGNSYKNKIIEDGTRKEAERIVKEYEKGEKELTRLERKMYN